MRAELIRRCPGRRSQG